MASVATHVLLPVLLLLALAARPSVGQGASIQLPCSASEDCDTTGAVCEAGACVCPAGQVMTSNLAQCLPGAGEWGAPCSDTVQCVSRLLVGGSCSPAEVIQSLTPTPALDATTDVCQCAAGYHYRQGQCWRSAGLGESCKRSENCYANHDSESVVCGDKSTCVCADGFYQREYSSCRRISTEYGQECGITQDCQYEASACKNRRCRCSAGYAYDKEAKKCTPKPTTAAPPTAASAVRHLAFENGDDVDDDDDSAAPRDVWRALFGARRVRRSASVGASTCTSASDCGAHSDCESGVCVCERGYFHPDGDATCRPEVLQACSQDADCTMKNAICRGAADAKVCSCKGGYVASKDMRICRKMSRALDWSCLHDEQCGYFGPGAVCESKRCKCSKGTHWTEEQQYCWVSRAVGEQCEAAEDCLGLGAGGECGWTGADGEVVGDGGTQVCGCAAGHHAAADGASCRVDAEGVGATCAEDEDCVTANTACSAGACACTAGYFPDANRGCQLGVGGPCTADSQCAAKGSVCADSKCACPVDHVPTQAGDACLDVVAALNGTCSETPQCEALSAQCTDGACLCGEDQHFRGGRCQKRKGLGERCVSSNECYLADFPERAECRNGLCKCGFQYTDNGDETCSSGAAAIAATAIAPLLAVAYLSLASLGWRS